MVTVDLYASEFTVQKDDDVLIGTFEATKAGVTFTRDGETEPMSLEAFEAEFGNEYPVRTDDDDEVMVSAKKDPDAYVKGLPDRFANGYIYAIIVPTKKTKS